MDGVNKMILDRKGKNEKRNDTGIVYHQKIAQVGTGSRRLSNTYLDILLSLIQFNRDNQSFFFFIVKNQHSGLNKVNWTRTIASTNAIVQNGQPIYLNPVNKKRRINFDEELLIIFFSTDIFSGFHSETEEDHQLSLSLMEACGYDAAFMFKYSERPGTYASKHLPDDVPEDVKIRRLNELIHLQTEMSALANKRDEGKVFDVLVEGFSKRSREQLCGRTEQNKMVVFDKGNHHVGETVRIRITGSSSATLFGEETV